MQKVWRACGIVSLEDVHLLCDLDRSIGARKKLTPMRPTAFGACLRSFARSWTCVFACCARCARLVFVLFFCLCAVCVMRFVLFASHSDVGAVINSEVHHLGYHGTEAYGITFKVSNQKRSKYDRPNYCDVIYKEWGAVQCWWWWCCCRCRCRC